MKLWVAVARHNFKCVKITSRKMGLVNSFFVAGTEPCMRKHACPSNKQHSKHEKLNQFFSTVREAGQTFGQCLVFVGKGHLTSGPSAQAVVQQWTSLDWTYRARCPRNFHIIYFNDYEHFTMIRFAPVSDLRHRELHHRWYNVVPTFHTLTQQWNNFIFAGYSYHHA